VADPVRLTEKLLEDLAARWRAFDAPVARQLRPGLADDEIDALVAPLGLRVPPEARTWWKWHNGGGDACIVHSGGKAFLSLEHCVERATMMRQIASEVTKPYRLSAEERNDMAHGVWHRDWLPLCPDGVGCMAVISAGRDDASKAVCPVLFRDWDGEASLLAPSIGTLVCQWISVLDAGAETYDHRQDRWVFVPEKLPPGYDDRIL